MLTDPQTITIDATPISFARTSSDGLRSTYQNSDGTYKLTVSHQTSKRRTRRVARIDRKVVAADPLTAVNAYQTVGVYLVIDQPDVGFTVDNVDDIIQGFKAWLTTAMVTAIMSSQS